MNRRYQVALAMLVSLIGSGASLSKAANIVVASNQVGYSELQELYSAQSVQF